MVLFFAVNTGVGGQGKSMATSITGGPSNGGTGAALQSSTGTNINQIRSSAVIGAGGAETSVATGTSFIKSSAASDAPGTKTSFGTVSSRASTPATANANSAASPVANGTGGVKTSTGTSRIASPNVGGAKVSAVASDGGTKSPDSADGTKISTNTGKSCVGCPVPGASADAETLKKALGVGAEGPVSHTGADAEVEKYLSAMLAGGRPGDMPQTSSDGCKEFSLYTPGVFGGGGGGQGSAYMVASTPSATKTKDVNFAFGNTTDQLGMLINCFPSS